MTPTDIYSSIPLDPRLDCRTTSLQFDHHNNTGFLHLSQITTSRHSSLLTANPRLPLCKVAIQPFRKPLALSIRGELLRNKYDLTIALANRYQIEIVILSDPLIILFTQTTVQGERMVPGAVERHEL